MMQIVPGYRGGAADEAEVFESVFGAGSEVGVVWEAGRPVVEGPWLAGDPGPVWIGRCARVVAAQCRSGAVERREKGGAVYEAEDKVVFSRGIDSREVATLGLRELVSHV